MTTTPFDFDALANEALKAEAEHRQRQADLLAEAEANEAERQRLEKEAAQKAQALQFAARYISHRAEEKRAQLAEQHAQLSKEAEELLSVLGGTSTAPEPAAEPTQSAQPEPETEEGDELLGLHQPGNGASATASASATAVVASPPTVTLDELFDAQAADPTANDVRTPRHAQRRSRLAYVGLLIGLFISLTWEPFHAQRHSLSWLVSALWYVSTMGVGFFFGGFLGTFFKSRKP